MVYMCIYIWIYGILLNHILDWLYIYTGWWLTYPSEKYEFVSWDDEIPNMMGKIKFMFQTTNQYMWRFLKMEVPVFYHPVIHFDRIVHEINRI